MLIMDCDFLTCGTSGLFTAFAYAILTSSHHLGSNFGPNLSLSCMQSPIQTRHRDQCNAQRIPYLMPDQDKQGYYSSIPNFISLARSLGYDLDTPLPLSDSTLQTVPSRGLDVTARSCFQVKTASSVWLKESKTLFGVVSLATWALQVDKSGGCEERCEYPVRYKLRQFL